METTKEKIEHLRKHEVQQHRMGVNMMAVIAELEQRLAVAREALDLIIDRESMVKRFGSADNWEKARFALAATDLDKPFP